MAFIYETKNFIVEAFETPHVTRTDGGHIRIKIKDESFTDRTKVSPEIAIEFMRLTMIVGNAMELAMNNRGINVVKINYQDMGTWAFKTGKQPFFHIHIYGRAKDAKYQPFPESVYLPDRSTGFYDKFEPLNNEDILEIQKQISIIEKQDKYQLNKWNLN